MSILEWRALVGIGLEIYKALKDEKQKGDKQKIEEIRKNPSQWLNSRFGNGLHDNTKAEKPDN